uniref:Uncharacterized protein n=1 Tax=Anguilla anguilla TaxID=7936 RepID=A0A0E9RAS8_ANGAN
MPNFGQKDIHYWLKHIQWKNLKTLVERHNTKALTLFEYFSSFAIAEWLQN